MKILVTGSSGHLGEALVRTLRESVHEVVGLDVLPSPFTDVVGSITDRARVHDCMQGVSAVLHTATLHKPHVATHGRQEFVDTNITGTLNLLEEAVAAKVGAFVFTSTTSAFGAALTPPPGAPAAWITESVMPVPKNIYGVTKVAAEDLCQLFHRRHGLPCVILRTSRFFPEADDSEAQREAYDDANLKANEFLHRRVEIADVVSAHCRALERAASIGFGRYIVSATTPFAPASLASLRRAAGGVVAQLYPQAVALYEARGWRLPDEIDRVYVNERARRDLDWHPVTDFAHILSCLREGVDWRSPLAQAIGAKGYHATVFADGPYPVSS